MDIRNTQYKIPHPLNASLKDMCFDEQAKLFKVPARFRDNHPFIFLEFSNTSAGIYCCIFLPLVGNKSLNQKVLISLLVWTDVMSAVILSRGVKLSIL